MEVKFKEYSNNNNINVIPKEEYEALVLDVFSRISETIGKSLGPYGSDNILIDYGTATNTKDGWNIFKSIKFDHIYKNMIYQLMKVPCQTMNTTVGDGTTTAIVLTELLYEQYKKRKVEIELMYRLPRTFTKVWDKCIDDICNKIKTYGRPIKSLDDIYNIAYVSSNGNEEVSNNIREIYAKSNTPNIKLRRSLTNKSYIEPINGFDFPSVFVDNRYARNDEKGLSTKNASVMIFDHKIDTDTFVRLISPINTVLRSNNEKLIIIAPTYDEVAMKDYIMPTINMEYRERATDNNLIITQFQWKDVTDKHLEDLSRILECEIITQKLWGEVVEYINQLTTDGEFIDFVSDNKFNLRAISYETHLTLNKGTSFILSDNYINSDEYKNLISEAQFDLDSKLATLNEKEKIFDLSLNQLRTRISRLKMENYNYYIGANTTLECDNLYDSVEDVIKATHSASKHGVVPGWQLSIIRACNEILTEDNNMNLYSLIIDLIRNAVIGLIGKIIHGPDLLGMLKTVDGWTSLSSIEEINKVASDKGREVIMTCINTNKVFDLETLEYTDNIIASVETDVNVLTAASTLVKLLISGKQWIYSAPKLTAEDGQNMIMNDITSFSAK